MKKIKEYFIVYSLGSVIYALIEVIWRGFTHWTMAITGGIAFLALYITNIRLKTKSLFNKCLKGALIITALEFVVGIIVNKILKWHVWDYSGRPFNIAGQICPLFFAFWFILCYPGYFLCNKIKKYLKI